LSRGSIPVSNDFGSKAIPSSLPAGIVEIKDIVTVLIPGTWLGRHSPAQLEVGADSEISDLRSTLALARKEVEIVDCGFSVSGRLLFL
jgi:hypothetical protein